MAENKVLSRRDSAALRVSAQSFTYRFFLSACFLLLILFSLAFHHTSIGVFVLAFINMLFCADIFVRCAWQDLSVGRFSFSLLVVLCAGAGFIYSACNTFLTHALTGPAQDLYLYVSFFLTLSLWAQRRLSTEKDRAHVFIKKLDDFLPKSGRLCVGRLFKKVFASELKTGEIIFVKPGERIPCDGTIRKGKTSVDEQLITGNMLPTSKTVGSTVYAGTLNKSAGTYVEVVRTLADSALLSIIEAIKSSESRRSGFQSPLDRFAAFLLPLVFTAAAAAYAYALYLAGPAKWFETLGVFLSVLSLGCPVAFVFVAVFPSFFARSGARAAKIKIQNLYALNEITSADTFFFDKTGTLTYGELRVSGVYPAKTATEKQLLETVATAEQLVDGPFADAVNGYAKKKGIKSKRLLCFDVLPGIGVQATCGREQILAGRSAWLEEQGIKIPAKHAVHPAESVICVARAGKYLGYLTLSDELRRGVKELVEFLKSQKKDIILVSGDNEASVAAIAQEAGIEKFNFNVLPKTKAEIISNLRALGKRVVMVGDGFNDIIALLQADAGIVFSSGRNVYNNWVDVIIKRRDLFPLMDLFKINKKFHHTAVSNVLLAFLLNAAYTGWLFWRLPQTAGWHVTLGGSLAVVVLIWLNSTRLLKVK